MGGMTFPGDDLRARREDMELSLQQAHDQVRVPIQYIRALEEGRMQDLPAATYTLGFIQSYCNFLGLHPEPFVDRYHTLTQMQRPAISNRQMASGHTMPRQRPRWVGEAMTWGAICGFLLLAWFTYATLTNPVLQEQENRVNAGTIEVTPPEVFEEGF